MVHGRVGGGSGTVVPVRVGGATWLGWLLCLAKARELFALAQPDVVVLKHADLLSAQVHFAKKSKASNADSSDAPCQEEVRSLWVGLKAGQTDIRRRNRKSKVSALADSKVRGLVRILVESLGSALHDCECEDEAGVPAALQLMMFDASSDGATPIVAQRFENEDGVCRCVALAFLDDGPNPSAAAASVVPSASGFSLWSADPSFPVSWTRSTLGPFLGDLANCGFGKVHFHCDKKKKTPTKTLLAAHTTLSGCYLDASQTVSFDPRHCHVIGGGNTSNNVFVVKVLPSCLLLSPHCVVIAVTGAQTWSIVGRDCCS